MSINKERAIFLEEELKAQKSWLNDLLYEIEQDQKEIAELEKSIHAMEVELAEIIEPKV